MDAGSMPGPGGTVDVAFELEGRELTGNYSFELMQEVARRLPWIGSEPAAGIHPLRTARTQAGTLLLPRRAKLVLRLPESRVQESMALCGQELSVGGYSLKIGAAKLRQLVPFGTLYAHLVTTAGETSATGDEQGFMRAMAADLRALNARCELVCGKHRTLRVREREISGYSLMLHGLTLEHSLRVQQAGLGSNRMLGCGIFVGHKSVAAVGALG